MIKASTTLITFFDDSKLYIGSLLMLLFDNLVILFEVSEWLLNLCTLVGEAQRSRRSWTLEAEENLLALNLSKGRHQQKKTFSFFSDVKIQDLKVT